MAARVVKYTFRASIVQVVRFVLILFGAAACLFLFFFKVSVAALDYDLVITPHFNKAWCWGINYDGKFEIWKRIRAGDGSIENRRLFP
ncbi:MAG: hypothetical protein NC924_06890 [Candidatus Omnitrophica bacterium]|nr:hypothetical protein [Candidatus Omnitrophota bacterium]